MKKQNFRPDTCDCYFEVNIDEQTGAMSVSQVFNTCPHHTSETIEGIFGSAMSDNQYKNGCVANVEADFGVKPEKVQWSFDDDRKLSLSHPDLTEENIQQSIDKVTRNE